MKRESSVFVFQWLQKKKKNNTVTDLNPTQNALFKLWKFHTILLNDFLHHGSVLILRRTQNTTSRCSMFSAHCTYHIDGWLVYLLFSLSKMNYYCCFTMTSFIYFPFSAVFRSKKGFLFLLCPMPLCRGTRCVGELFAFIFHECANAYYFAASSRSTHIYIFYSRYIYNAVILLLVIARYQPNAV